MHPVTGLQKQQIFNKSLFQCFSSQKRLFHRNLSLKLKNPVLPSPLLASKSATKKESGDLETCSLPSRVACRHWLPRFCRDEIFGDSTSVCSSSSLQAHAAFSPEQAHRRIHEQVFQESFGCTLNADTQFIVVFFRAYRANPLRQLRCCTCHALDAAASQFLSTRYIWVDVSA